MARHPRLAAGGLLLLAFGYRLVYGIRGYWHEDDRQIYLIGLKSFTTNTWPYYGPDVIYTHSQIPGALQGLLVRIPFQVWAVPEAPFVLVNLLSLAALSLLAWYIGRRMPGLPAWFTWGWLLSAPWTINYSTHIRNPDYLLLGSVIFFIGFFESQRIRPAIVKPLLAWFMLGFGILWVFQLHLSWPILVPFVGYALVHEWRASPRTVLPALAGLTAGAAVPLAVLLPTLIKYGLANGLGGTQQNLVFTEHNPVVLFVTIVARFLSFASAEAILFMGNSTERNEFLLAHTWVIPIAVFVVLVGYLQPVVLLVAGFRSKAQVEWPLVRGATAAAAGLLFVAFFFSVASPRSYMMYVVVPLVMLYSMYVWYPHLQRPGWRRFAAGALVANFVLTLAFLTQLGADKRFAGDRPKIVDAISTGDHGRLGQRRSDKWGCCY